MTLAQEAPSFDLVTADQLAVISGVSRSTIYRNIRRGSLAPAATEPRWLFAADSLPRAPERWLWPNEVAALFGVVEGCTIRHWVRDGKLDCDVTPGGRRRFRESTVIGALRRTGFPLLPLLDAARAVGVKPMSARSLDRRGRIAHVTEDGQRLYTTPAVARAFGLTDRSYLTTTEAADRFDVFRDTVALWVKQGKLPGLRMPGGEWLVPATAVPLSVGSLTAQDVARAIGVSDSTIRHWAQVGLITGHKHPGASGEWRFRLGEIDRARNVLANLKRRRQASKRRSARLRRP